jgi:HAD superfamily hydrolase (TIGR01509 family)
MPSAPPIRVLSFDVFGTLLDLEEDRARPEAYLHLARWLGYHGLAVDPAEMHRRLDTIAAERMHASVEPYPDVQMLDVLEEAVAGLAAAGRHDPDLRRTLQPLLPPAALLLRTLTTVSLAMVPHAAGALAELAADFRLGICSNTQRAYTIGELSMFDLLAPFEHIVFSSDVRAAKPGERIFERFLDEFGVQAEEVVHIGDRLLDDVEGALAMGMRAIWLDRQTPAPGSSSASEPTLPAGVPIIRDLRELPLAIAALES